MTLAGVSLAIAAAPNSHSCVVSLQQLEGRLRTAIATMGPAAVDSVTLGNCADIVGYRWRKTTGDIELLGIAAADSEKPITAGQFADGLRLAVHEIVGMSLVPQQLRPDTMHEVRVFPDALRDSRTLSLLTPADYSIKASLVRWLVEHQRRALDAATAGSPSHEILSGRVFFVPTEPDLDFTEEGASAWIVWLRAPVALKPAQDLIISGEVAGSMQPDPLITTFCDDYNRRWNEFARQPVFRDLQRAYTLVLAGTLLRAETVAWNRKFWLEELALPPFPSPRVLPAHKPTTLRRISWEGAEYEYSGVQRMVTVWGGAILGWKLPSPMTFGARAIGAGAVAGQLIGENRLSSWQLLAQSFAVPMGLASAALGIPLGSSSVQTAGVPIGVGQASPHVSAITLAFPSTTPSIWGGRTGLPADFSFPGSRFPGLPPGGWMPLIRPTVLRPCVSVGVRVSC
jgi:hypothetical protein